MRTLSFQIGIETTTRCGGACAGCALTSSERQDPKGLDESLLSSQLKTAKGWIQSHLEETPTDIEAITVFLGQGDHFLMQEDELVRMAAIVGEQWPAVWRMKTVFLLTASAVTQPAALRKRAKALKAEGLKHQCNWFVQVVFDPKKFNTTHKFKDVYLGNILFLKEEFTMVELTVNLAGDIAAHMTPLEFHEWVKTHRFKHVEFNLAARRELWDMWTSDLDTVWRWLKEFIALAWKDRVYEVNFMPWTARRLSAYQHEGTNDVLQVAERALYITGKNDALPAQVGPIGNVSPWADRLATLSIGENRMALRVLRHFATAPTCNDCEFRGICASGGVYAWTSLLPKVYKRGCPWGLDTWYTHVKRVFSETPHYNGSTVFDKNPVPDELLKACAVTQDTRHYFESKQVGE
jgi:hypothetical protein